MSLSIRRVRNTHIEKYRWGLNCSIKTLILLSLRVQMSTAELSPADWLTGKSHQYWHASYSCLCLLKQNREMWRDGKEPWHTPCAELGLQTAAGCTEQSRTHLDSPVVLLLDKHSTKSCALARNAQSCVCPAPHGVGGTKQMCKNLQRCRLGGVGAQPQSYTQVLSAVPQLPKCCFLACDTQQGSSPSCGFS